MGIKAQMAVSCGLLPVLLALGVYAAVAATIMQTSEIEEDNTDLLAKLNADLDALIETGETMDTAPAAAAPPAPPPSPEAVETKAKYGHVHHNEKPMASLTAIPGYKPSDKEKAEAKDPDPFKQGKTYTPELRHHEERVKAKDPAVFDLNHFKTPAAKIKRAQKLRKIFTDWCMENQRHQENAHSALSNRRARKMQRFCIALCKRKKDATTKTGGSLG